MKSLFAPFTPSVLRDIEEFQSSNIYLPYRCPLRGQDVHDNTILVPLKDFLACPEKHCHYQQFWVSGEVIKREKRNDDSIDHRAQTGEDQ